MPFLFINNEHWKVQRKQISTWGECNYETHTITISSRLGKENAQITLLHEVIHALFAQQSKKKFTEEEVCEILDKGLTRFLKENPDFAKML